VTVVGGGLIREVGLGGVGSSSRRRRAMVVAGTGTTTLRPHGTELFDIHWLGGVHGGSGSRSVAAGRLGGGRGS